MYVCVYLPTYITLNAHRSVLKGKLVPKRRVVTINKNESGRRYNDGDGVMTWRK